ncbi:asparagine synthase (glutamine-hydrolyzing) [Candidatus Nitrospira neomarina]|uniref:asparagine synthase (glutamine-hydrolyzing) n=1 Tax=Candidatus Nitrospira neomarina TaxID=3020899 RepID=A0AA96GG27_9BACT|nr:asparagine synthase (glutamine-hydrolyzing) [Candidatus Nitrospira neomarina]WNM61116.1 asparagine synthase (glutamine-hydrolyzing) [Candidatus Nitrospira neomarina]
MCGLCGVVYSDPMRPVDRDMLHHMTNMMAHRGPDGDGYFVEPGIGLGFRRLSIIDLETGDQPISNEDHSVTVVCNGEIYNYKELRQDLEATGHRFRTHSDVEVLVHLYEDYGVRCVDFLRGMFGFAIWDSRHRRLMLARDRFGIKPLSYAIKPGALFFGSELKSILASGCIDRQVDAAAMKELFAVGFVQAPKTLLRSIRRLPPAHYLLHENGKITIQRYWDLSFPSMGEDGIRRSVQEWAEAVREKLEESVRLHLRSDVPLGCYLSSGIDSSAMAGLMGREISAPIHTFSAAFEDPLFNEIGPNRILTDFPGYNLRNHITTCSTADFDLLPEMIWHREDPNISAGGIPHMLLARMAAQQVKVVLTGEGSDEIFGGYPWYRVERLLEPFINLPLSVRQVIANIPFLRKKYSRSSRAFAAHATMDRSRYTQIIDNASHRSYDDLFSDHLSNIHNSFTDSEPPFSLPKDFEGWSRFAQLQYLDINVRLSDFITRTLDAASMAYGLEARVPFLDHEFVELCSQIPSDLKMRGLQEKHILRRALEGVLPAEILNRKKRGLSAPFWPWQGRLPEFVADALSENRLHTKGYFNPHYVRYMLQQHQNGKANFGRELIGVLNIQLWDDLFVQGCRPS